MAHTVSETLQRFTKDGRLPGTGAIAIDKTGKQIYNEAFGDIDTSNPEKGKYTNNTQMLLWSCTKLLTSLAALQLLEQGKIESIDDPVSKYLPERADVKVITGFDDDNKPITRAPKTEMKLIHLWTHTAGYSKSTEVLPSRQSDSSSI